MHWSFAHAMKDRRVLVATGVAAVLAAYLAGRPLLRVAFAHVALPHKTSSTANVSITVLEHPRDVIPTQGIAFGPVVRPSAGANTVSVGADGATSLAGRGDARLALGPSHPAAFAVTGAPDTVYSISRTLSPGSAGGLDLRLGALKTRVGSPGVISFSGTQEIGFGASFNINPFTALPPRDDVVLVIVAFN
jgi:hypothetical protein